MLIPVEPLPAPAPPPTSIEEPLVNGIIIDIMKPDDPNAIIADQPPVNGVVNGITQHHEEQPQEQQQEVAVMQLPRLYDIDLEKMHADLFKGRYLTPSDFLDDIGKMVHNANARAHEDLDRLYRAQAMFTAAQVSIQEFDPQFRLECERMAVRERRRLAELKVLKQKEREKERGKSIAVANDHVSGYLNGMRRSARNNGQGPELGITDPVLLERRLKRQRSNEGGSDAHGSEEEKDNGENREAKRTKIVTDTDDDRDPLDLVSPTQPRVHFAPEIGFVQLLDGNRKKTPEDGQDTNMAVDDTPHRQRTKGFDPMLLNPMPSPEIERNAARDGSPSNLSIVNSSIPETPPVDLPDDPLNPFLSYPSIPAGPSSPSPLSSIRPSKSPELEIIPPQPPSPMVVERQPTPLPDFHVDDVLLRQLESCLRDETHSLTIEELEQLRATCLGNVWRYRTEWNRDGLVQELLQVVQTFVSQIASSP